MPLAREQLAKVPAAVRPTLQAARRTVKAAAPKAEEIAYRSSPPRSKSAMWKIVRYTVKGEPVIGIGVFPTYASIFFYRGRELDDGSGLLEGGGKDMRAIRVRSPADAANPAVKRIVKRAVSLGG
jgi:hypothetical protein